MRAKPYPARRQGLEAMSITLRTITLAELRRNSGERGARKYIAYRGLVYDVTDCPKWRPDMHEQLHFPGQDLTSELPEAPHQEEVFKHDCVKIVGRLAADEEHGAAT
jgi:predicted heme/steroid binding protein